MVALPRDALAVKELRRRLTEVGERRSVEFANAISGLYPASPDEMQHVRAVHKLRELVDTHGAPGALSELAKIIRRPSVLSSYFNPSPTSANATAAVVHALGELKDARFLDFMVKEGLRHGDPVVRLATVNTLRRMGTAARPAKPALFLLSRGSSEKHPVVKAELASLVAHLTGIKTPQPKPTRRPTGFVPSYSEVRLSPVAAAREVRRP